MEKKVNTPYFADYKIGGVYEHFTPPQLKSCTLLYFSPFPASFTSDRTVYRFSKHAHMHHPFSFHILAEMHHLPFKLIAQPSAQAPNQAKSPPHTTRHPRTPNPHKPTSLHHACSSPPRVGFLKNDNGRGEVHKSLLLGSADSCPGCKGRWCRCNRFCCAKTYNNQLDAEYKYGERAKHNN